MTPSPLDYERNDADDHGGSKGRRRFEYFTAIGFCWLGGVMIALIPIGAVLLSQRNFLGLLALLFGLPGPIVLVIGLFGWRSARRKLRR